MKTNDKLWAVILFVAWLLAIILQHSGLLSDSVLLRVIIIIQVGLLLVNTVYGLTNIFKFKHWIYGVNLIPVGYVLYVMFQGLQALKSF